MTIQEIQQEILRMKKEQDVCILAHAYQGQEILEVADYMGDSYGLRHPRVTVKVLSCVAFVLWQRPVRF